MSTAKGYAAYAVLFCRFSGLLTRWALTFGDLAMRLQLLTIPLLIGSLSAQAASEELRLPTAADGEVTILMDSDTKLPLSASDDRVEVTKAALTFLPKEPNAPLRFTWQYELRFKTASKVKAITIENERDKELQSVVKDASPDLQDTTWIGQELSQEVTKGFVNAMYAKDPWVLLRRITVNYDDGGQSKLHQLIIMTQPMRMNLVQKTMEELKAAH